MELPPVEMKPTDTSFFSKEKRSLDPTLFYKGFLRPNLRSELLDHYLHSMNSRFKGADRWSKLWMVGSGASYQWASKRSPMDLDMQVGIDYPKFRSHNPSFSGLGDNEISGVVNNHFYEHSNIPQWKGKYDVTWYNNPVAASVDKIHPYAAYNLTNDYWDVHPDHHGSKSLDDPWGDKEKAQDILDEYNHAREQLSRDDLDVMQRSAQGRSLSTSLVRAHSLYDQLHEGRNTAFSADGGGYDDPTNIRWQTAKALGVVDSMKALAELHAQDITASQLATYGMTLKSPQDILIYSMLSQERR